MTTRSAPWLSDKDRGRHIPAHWQIVPLKRLVRCLDGQRRPLNAEERSYMQGDIPYWGANGIVDYLSDWLFDEDLILLGEDGAPFFDSSRPVAFFVQGRVWVNNHAHVLRPTDRVDPRFLVNVLNTIDYADFIEGSTRDKLTQGKMRELPIQVPPVAEQDAIAAFLDRKTAAIDELIREKERLIELLQEKRQALITQAVTKGLDPTVPMKESGIEWLGTTPTHWALKRLKHVTPQVTVGIVVTPAKYYVDEGVPCPRSFNISPGKIGDNELAYISHDSNLLHVKSIIRERDLVSVRTGKPGTTAVVDDRFDGANCVDLIITRRSRHFDSQFLCYFMNAAPAHEQYRMGSEGALQQHFNVETAKNLVVPLPPMEEQRQIAASLSEATDRAERLDSLLTHHVAMLRDYRQALISAAVTGQIDATQGTAA